MLLMSMVDRWVEGLSLLVQHCVSLLPARAEKPCFVPLFTSDGTDKADPVQGVDLTQVMDSLECNLKPMKRSLATAFEPLEKSILSSETKVASSRASADTDLLTETNPHCMGQLKGDVKTETMASLI